DYLKLDGCNVHVPGNESSVAAYRKAYRAESRALKVAGRPIVFSESAPAYFQGTPDWYDVLSWVRRYGQLWREGSDIATFNANKPDTPRFHSVLWNYAYNLPLGRFQKPGNWNDPDFIIGGDRGMTLAETRSQMALWSMMAAPLILSSGVEKLSPEAVAILGNKAVIAIDQDSMGRMATLVRRSPVLDVLFKPLRGGKYAVAALNRSTAPLRIELRPADLGFGGNAGCRLNARNLWSGTEQRTASTLQAEIAPHDTAIWSTRPAASCGTPSRTGTITTTAAGKHRDVESYSRCLASGHVEACAGSPAETWTVTSGGVLKSSAGCLAVVNGKPLMQPCSNSKAQRWRYTLTGELIDAGNNECLTSSDEDSKMQHLSLAPCGHNRSDQIWSLPN
ncbi:MAG: ricin-type beta-trefoil lectin domain protein, partial [Bryobacteraceae bacterium]